MADFSVNVLRIDAVEDHPGADRLSIVSVLGFKAITAKNLDGSHAHAVGDLIVYVPEQAVIPHDLLKKYGYWDDVKDRGMLAGGQYDRVKIIKLRGVYSQGLIWPIRKEGNATFLRDGSNVVYVKEGDDVTEFFGITKHEPKAASFQTGGGSGAIDTRIVMVAPEFALTYDFNSLQKDPKFLANDEVEVTEKLHGTLTRVSYRRWVQNPDLFGSGGVAVTTKGQGAKGIVFKNNRMNMGPLYLPTARDEKHAKWRRRLPFKFLHSLFGITEQPKSDKINLYVGVAVQQGLIDAVEAYGVKWRADVDLVGETYGQGVQKDYSYGQSVPVFKAFDIRVNGEWLDSTEKVIALNEMGIDRVPVLWKGMFDLAKLTELRDGKTTIAAEKGVKSNIREGIVITATGPQSGRERRPIQKMVSPDYLMKETGDEVQ